MLMETFFIALKLRNVAAMERWSKMSSGQRQMSGYTWQWVKGTRCGELRVEFPIDACGGRYQWSRAIWR
jgi:hypothetical protein